MKNAAPWSIKGIEREAREMAKVEARKNGMTLGQWLNHIIAGQGEQHGKTQKASQGVSEGVSENEAENEVSFDNNVHARMNVLAQQLAKLTISQSEPDEDISGSAPQGDDRDGDVLKALRELSSRFEQSERQTAEILSEFKDDLNLIAGYIHPEEETAEDVMASQRAGNNGSVPQKGMPMDTMEEALALVVDHIELTDKRNGDVLKSIQSRLSEIGGRMNTMAPAAGQKNHGRISEMETRVEELAAMLNRQSGQDTSAPYRELEAKIARINQDMQLASRKIQNTAANTKGSPEFATLQDKIMQMSRELNEIKNTPQPSHEISSLQGRYEELAESLHETRRHIPDIEQVNSIEARLHDLAGRLDKSLQDSDPHPQLVDLETRVNELGAQLEKTGEQSRWDELLPKLDAKFVQINNRLGQTEEKFKVLEGFDDRINELFKGLDQARETAAETARQAAGQAARQVAQQVAQQATQQATQQASEIARKVASEASETTRTAIREAAGLAAAQAVAKLGGQRVDEGEFKTAFDNLERGLDDVRSKSDSVEKRTQETLKTVHASLEKVINRLSGLEEKIAESPEKTEPDRQPLPRASSDEPQSADTDLRLPPIEDIYAGSASSSGDARTLGDSLEQIYGSANTGGYGADMKSAYPAPGNTDTRMGGVNRNEDFIAAARRAAQTAAQTPSIGAEFDNTPGLPGEEGNSKLGSVIARNRKPLLYAGIAILLMGGLYGASSMFTGDVDAPQIVQNSEPVQAEPPTGLAATPPAISAPQPEAAAPVKTPPPATMAPPPAEILAGSPVSTNSIPATKPEAVTPKPLHMALGAPAKSTIRPKTKVQARSTGNLPAAIGTAGLRGAAVAGNPTAQYEIAHRYATGKGVAKDYKQAKIWYEKAASRGLAMAQYRLGTLYEKGQGVPKDLATASTWYKRAAGKGNRKAMHNLAVLNAEGGINGSKPDFTKAAQWFRKASDLGLTDSQFNLAILSERGLGVPQSKIDAYKWFALAARNGDKDAANRMETIANQLDSKTLVKARLAAKTWKARPVNISANRISAPVGGWANAKATPSHNAAIDEMTMQAQSLLAALGYKPGSADGMMGLKTRNAIMKFQSNEGLTATGIVSPALIARLKAASG